MVDECLKPVMDTISMRTKKDKIKDIQHCQPNIVNKLMIPQWSFNTVSLYHLSLAYFIIIIFYEFTEVLWWINLKL